MVCYHAGVQPIPDARSRYLAETLGPRPLKVLDLGCGLGTDIKFLLSLGHDAYGCDVIQQEEERRRILGPLFAGAYDEHIHVTRSEDEIPFADRQFDAVISNQVFEHVRLFSAMMSECARVLTPTGTLIINFPTLLTPYEVHVRAPFIHWLPPGKLRRAYARLLWPVWPPIRRSGMSAREGAAFHDRFLRNETYYRTVGEILSVGEFYFRQVELGTRAAVRLKLQSPSRLTRIKAGLQLLLADLCGEEVLNAVFSGTFVLREPRNASDRPIPEQWSRMDWKARMQPTPETAASEGEPH